MPVAPKYNQKTFNGIYSNYTDFFNDASLFSESVTLLEADYKLIWFRLTAYYGDNPINTYLNEPRWKMKLFSIINDYGPEWKRKLEIQNTLRTLSEDDILKNSTALYNHSWNPNTEPSTEELDYINEQNVTKYKKSKMEGYVGLYTILRSDITANFIKKFQKLFSKFALPDKPLYLYEDDE